MLKLALLVAGAVSLCGQNNRSTPLQAITHPSTAAKSATTAKAGPMELQETCAKQAEHFFQQFLVRNAGDKWSYDYTNNYSPDLNRCFVLVEGSSPDLTLRVTLYDAFTRKAYGLYFKLWELNAEEKGLDAASSFKCFVVKLPAGEKETCKSVDEFTKLVEFYMGK